MKAQTDSVVAFLRSSSEGASRARSADLLHWPHARRGELPA